MRRSLIDKYNGQLNEGTVDDYTNADNVSFNEHPKNQVNVNPTDASMLRLEGELKTGRNQKVKYIIAGIVILLLIGIILAITLGGKNKPHVDPIIPPVVWDGISNPYTIIPDAGGNSYRTYRLAMNKSMSTKFQSAYLNETLDNKFIESATLKT